MHSSAAFRDSEEAWEVAICPYLTIHPSGRASRRLQEVYQPGANI